MVCYWNVNLISFKLFFNTHWCFELTNKLKKTYVGYRLFASPTPYFVALLNSSRNPVLSSFFPFQHVNIFSWVIKYPPAHTHTNLFFIYIHMYTNVFFSFLVNCWIKLYANIASLEYILYQFREMATIPYSFNATCNFRT